MTARALSLDRRAAPLPAGRLAAALATPVLSVAVGLAAVRHPEDARLLLAALLAGALVVTAAWRPRAAILAALVLLPFLGLGRRLLIPVAGWSSHDPLLLVAPALAVFLVVRLFFLERRAIAPDRLSKLVLALLVLTVVQAFNPLGGGLVAGVGALLFAGVPLLWFFVGRELVDRSTAVAALALVPALGIPIALYGLRQGESGFPSWDAAWIDRAGYAALSVASSTRAFGTMASAAEYAYYLGSGVVVLLAWALHGRILALAPIPLLGWGLFLQGSRTIMVLAFATSLILLGLRIGSTRAMAATLALGLLAAVLTLRAFEAPITERADASGNPIVQHQVEGLLNPLDTKRSTLQIHRDAVVRGLETGVREPLGHGIASTTLGGSKFGGRSGSTEVDVSNAFVSLGLAGGLVFIAVVVVALRRATALYRRTRSVAAFAATAVLVLTLGQWLNGGYYAVAPLVWLLIGWANAAWLRETGRA